MVSPSTDLRARKAREIARLADDGLDAGTLLDRVREPLRAVVPFDGGFLFATDPATTLFTAGGIVESFEPSSCAPTLDNEFLADDFNKFADLHRTRSAATTLHRATLDRPTRSARHTDVNTPSGFGPELRAVAEANGDCWGVLSLVRETGAPDFTAEELAFVDAVTPLLAAGLRRSVIHAPAVAEDPHLRPGVVLLDGDGRVTSMTDRGAELLAELRHDPVPTSGRGGPMLPGEAYIVGARARSRAMGWPGPDPVIRLRGRSGAWLTVRADCTMTPDGRVESTALVIEPSRANEIVPLFVRAYGLSDREAEVLALLASGHGTDGIANRLFISVHTVRAHIKSMFEKVGVSSRGELVSAVYLLTAEPRLDVRHDAG